MKKSKRGKGYTVVDLFAGVGGLSMGFQREGFKTLFANDIDADAVGTFKLNNPKIPVFDKDIKKLDKKKITELIGNQKVDILMGGIPCQSFSIKGKRILGDNKDDPRNYLFKEFMRVLNIIKPKIAIIENVKGILSIQNGAIKEAILTGFENSGYSVDFKVLNAADFGVPQSRERVVFIANRINKINKFPKETHSKENHIGVGEVLKDIPHNNHEPKMLSGKVLERVKLIKQGENWEVLPKKLQTGSKHSGAYGRLHPKKPSRTLTTRFDTPPGGYVTHPIENRAITVREGARIQTFPDNFIFTGKRISQYKQVGNAVPVNLSQALAKSTKEMLTND